MSKTLPLCMSQRYRSWRARTQPVPVIKGLARSETSVVNRQTGNFSVEGGAYRDRPFQNPAGEERDILPTEMPRGASGPYYGAPAHWALATWSVCSFLSCCAVSCVCADGTRTASKAVDWAFLPDSGRLRVSVPLRAGRPAWPRRRRWT
jgi:hypothetical protein